MVVMAGLVGVGLTAPASACPQGTRCIAMASGMAELSSIRMQRTETPAARPAPVQHLSLTVHLTDEGNYSLRRSLTSFRPAVTHAEDIVMPELWAVVATTVRAQLPRYETEESFSMVLSPVVVTMPTESTPGLGLSGDF
jgi:hypothetical protein